MPLKTGRQPENSAANAAGISTAMCRYVVQWNGQHGALDKGAKCAAFEGLGPACHIDGWLERGEADSRQGGMERAAQWRAAKRWVGRHGRSIPATNAIPDAWGCFQAPRVLLLQVKVGGNATARVQDHVHGSGGARL